MPQYISLSSLGIGDATGISAAGHNPTSVQKFWINVDTQCLPQLKQWLKSLLVDTSLFALHVFLKMVGITAETRQSLSQFLYYCCYSCMPQVTEKPYADLSTFDWTLTSVGGVLSILSQHDIMIHHDWPTKNSGIFTMDHWLLSHCSDFCFFVCVWLFFFKKCWKTLFRDFLFLIFPNDS